MRKTIRLLNGIREDLFLAERKIRDRIWEETNTDIAQELQDALKKVEEAYKAVGEAKDTCSQIYQECYDD